MLLRLAWRNLVGAGMRTALNVVVLSITFVAIVGTLGLLEGFNRQTSRAMIEGEYGGGQYLAPGVRSARSGHAAGRPRPRASGGPAAD